MMQYLLLIYHDEKANTQMNPQEMQDMMDGYWVFGDEAAKKGVLRGGEGLHPTTAATTVRVRNGKTLTTDGPFAETKEQLGGYYLVDCQNLDEAIEWAAKIPDARGGSVEIRPIMVFDRPA
jgi:hypothetical protein